MDKNTENVTFICNWEIFRCLLRKGWVCLRGASSEEGEPHSPPSDQLLILQRQNIKVNRWTNGQKVTVFMSEMIKPTWYCDGSGDVVVFAGVVVKSQARIWTSLVLSDVDQLQLCSCAVHESSFESPLELGCRVGLSRAEHGQVRSSSKGRCFLSVHSESHVVRTI